MAFKDNVRRLRKRRGMTQKQLAWMAGVTQPHITHIESGARGASLDLVGRIRKALRCSWADLMRGE